MSQLYKKHKMIYNGMEKCAQTALYFHFGSSWDGPGVLGEGVACNKDKASQVKAKYPDYKFIVFVRNPWDRILSCYYYYIQHAKQVNDYSFENWVDDSRAGRPNPLGSWLNSMVSIADEMPDFVGRYERINTDVRKLMKLANVPYQKLLWKNRSSRRKKRGKRSYREFYTKDYMIEYVANYYAKDIEFFDYDF